MAIFQENLIVVTGASESIGRALCLAIANQKPKLVLAARNQNRLIFYQVSHKPLHKSGG